MKFTLGCVKDLVWVFRQLQRTELKTKELRTPTSSIVLINNRRAFSLELSGTLVFFNDFSSELQKHSRGVDGVVLRIAHRDGVLELFSLFEGEHAFPLVSFIDFWVSTRAIVSFTLSSWVVLRQVSGNIPAVSATSFSLLGLWTM